MKTYIFGNYTLRKKDIKSIYFESEGSQATQTKLTLFHYKMPYPVYISTIIDTKIDSLKSIFHSHGYTLISEKPSLDNLADNPFRMSVIKWAISIYFLLTVINNLKSYSYEFESLDDIIHLISSLFQPNSGVIGHICVIVFFLIIISIWKVKLFQAMLLKPGRYPGEVRPILYMLSVLFGIISLFIVVGYI